MKSNLLAAVRKSVQRGKINLFSLGMILLSFLGPSIVRNTTFEVSPTEVITLQFGNVLVWVSWILRNSSRGGKPFRSLRPNLTYWLPDRSFLQIRAIVLGAIL
jgi:hypothetical protein